VYRSAGNLGGEVLFKVEADYSGMMDSWERADAARAFCFNS
jgi:hypothetical protein